GADSDARKDLHVPDQHLLDSPFRDPRCSGGQRDQQQHLQRNHHIRGPHDGAELPLHLLDSLFWQHNPNRSLSARHTQTLCGQSSPSVFLTLRTIACSSSGSETKRSSVKRSVSMPLRLSSCVSTRTKTL